MIVTEFGACMDTDRCVTEIAQVTDEADKKLTSWAYWIFKTFEDPTTQAGSGEEGFYNADGSIQGEKVKMLARTYIQSAQGTIQSNEFKPSTSDSATRTFNASFNLDCSVEAPTVIHAFGDAAHDEPTWYDGSIYPGLYLLNEEGEAVDIDDSLVNWVDAPNMYDGVPNKYSFMLDASLDGQLIYVTI
jgi:hypothetical protein